MIPLPPLSRWFTGGALCLAAAALVAKAALFGDPDEFVEYLLGDALGVASGVFLAAGGINELARGMQRRKWKRLTAPQVVELVQQISDQLVQQADDAYSIVSPAIPPGVGNPFADAHWDVAAAFTVGLAATDTTQRVLEAVDAATKALLGEGREGLDGDAERAVVAAAKESVDSMAARADDLKARITELSNYRDPAEAAVLIQEVTRLDRSTEDLVRHVPDGRTTGIGIAAANVLDRCHALKPPLDATYRDVTFRADPTLRRRVS
jgi:hypothetical protein